MSRLICNIKKCRQTLLQAAYITTCSHIFCTDHGLTLIMDENFVCPACNMRLNKPQGIIRINLNPDEVTKSIMLAGLSPDVIMDILTRGLGFWVYQANEENLYLETSLKTAHENIVALGDYCENNYAKYKKETDLLNQKIQSLNEELEVNKKRCEELIQQLEEKTKVITKLQLNPKQNSYSAINNTSERKENLPNYFNQKFQNPAAFNASFNEYRVPKPEPSTSSFSNSIPKKPQYFPNFTQNMNFILKPESIRSVQELDDFARFSPKFEDPESFPLCSQLSEQPNIFPPMHPANRNGMASTQEFNFQPNFD